MVMAKRKGQARKRGGQKGRARAAKAARKGSRKSRRASSARAKAKPQRKAKRPATRASAPARRGSKKARKAVKAKKAVRRAAKATRRVNTPAKAAAKPAARKSPAIVRAAPRRAPTLDRERRTVREEEMVPSPPSSLDLDRSASAVRTGRAEFNEKLHKHTSTGPSLTAGDVDADWEAAESVGDEAPGGDNPTPDQDVVDEIGKALGVEYDDDEELRGGDEIVERDRNRWELDPASSDDFDDRDE
jgi:hypothetical protein